MRHFPTTSPHSKHLTDISLRSNTFKHSGECVPCICLRNPDLQTANCSGPVADPGHPRMVFYIKRCFPFKFDLNLPDQSQFHKTPTACPLLLQSARHTYSLPATPTVFPPHLQPARHTYSPPATPSNSTIQCAVLLLLVTLRALNLSDISEALIKTIASDWQIQELH